jgi:hypothetical protein
MTHLMSEVGSFSSGLDSKYVTTGVRSGQIRLDYWILDSIAYLYHHGNGEGTSNGSPTGIRKKSLIPT